MDRATLVRVAVGALASAGVLGPACAHAQPGGAEETRLEEVIVTAQKREERLSDVGMTITALSGESLERQGVTDVTQLAKVVPGLSYFTSTTATPVYSLRGVGFNESSLAAYPAASVYVDEIPLPFPAMTTQAGLDAARVEVLKGPQGTLFGQNSTAGAINYVAASPTNELTAAADLSYGRFDTFRLAGHVSGPITETLGFRLSVDSTRGDDWQKSYTRPGDTLGDVKREAARLLLAWSPTDDLKVRVNLNGWLDRSEPPAAQLVGITPGTPRTAFPALLNYPLLPSNNGRLADWSPTWGIGADDTFWQAAVRGDYDFGGAALTWITSYADYVRDQRGDLDGMSLASTNFLVKGRIRAFFQEARLASPASRPLRWIVGANYARDKVRDRDDFAFGDATGGRAFGFGFAGFFSDQKMTNKAAFADVEFSALPNLTLKAGARYTESDRSIQTCSFDDGDGGAARTFTFIARMFRPTAPAILPGQCFTLNPQTFAAGLFTSKLTEDNLSWRIGADFKPSDDVLLYANIAKGYKAGSYPTVQASFQTQYQPVTQESLLDYEVGAKIQAWNGRLAIEAAAFYYDYQDKQLRGKLVDPVFGPLEALQNIPESHVKGLELAVDAAPARGLAVGFDVTWLDAEIDRFTGVNGAGLVANFAGAPMPYTPKWQVAAHFDYDFSLTDSLDGFVGANLLHHSSTYAAIGTTPIPGTGFNRDLAIKAYTTLDLRAGVAAADESWRLSIWGRNVTNTYYWNNVARISDVVVRYPGMPVTYGLTLSVAYP
jgi:outer membrane receptor protein involved in Fe transport